MNRDNKFRNPPRQTGDHKGPRTPDRSKAAPQRLTDAALKARKALVKARASRASSTRTQVIIGFDGVVDRSDRAGLLDYDLYLTRSLGEDHFLWASGWSPEQLETSTLADALQTARHQGRVLILRAGPVSTEAIALLKNCTVHLVTFNAEALQDGFAAKGVRRIVTPTEMLQQRDARNAFADAFMAADLENAVLLRVDRLEHALEAAGMSSDGEESVVAPRMSAAASLAAAALDNQGGEEHEEDGESEHPDTAAAMAASFTGGAPSAAVPPQGGKKKKRDRR